MACASYSLAFFVILRVAAGAKDSWDGSIEEGPRHIMRVEAQDAVERHVEIGPHGDALLALTAKNGSKASGVSETYDSKPDSSVKATAKVSSESSGDEDLDLRSHPSLEGFKDNDCRGEQMANYVYPKNIQPTTECIETMNAKTGKPHARVTISCEHNGNAKACIWMAANDTSCMMEVPTCISIKAIHAPLVAAGECVPVHNIKSKTESFAMFKNFPEDTVWPECLSPAMSQSLMMICVMGGVMGGFLILFFIWQGCFALSKLPGKQMPYIDHGKGGYGGGYGGGDMKGGMKGKGGPPQEWGGKGGKPMGKW